MEITHVQGKQIAPDGVRVAHPAFDVTPHRLVSAIITEKGVVHGRYAHTLSELVGK